MGRRSLEMGDQRPFGLPWLDSCYQETLLPEAKWHTVLEMLCEGLAKKINKHIKHEKRRQMIFELIGEDFVNKYFQDQQYNPSLIKPPSISVEDLQKLKIDAENWLQNAVKHVASEVGCQRPEVVEKEDGIMSAEMEDFLHQAKSIVQKGMERHLYLQEEVLVKKKKEKMEALEKMKKDHVMWAKWTAAEERKRRSSHIRGILKNSHPQPLTPSSTTSGSSPVGQKLPSTARVREELYTPEDQPPMWGYQSDSLGRSLVAILKRDPGRFSEIAWRLHGRQLPGTLRKYIWLDVLLLADRSSHQGADVNVEKIVRERFGMAVSRGLEMMKLTRATHSPISSLIDKAVIEIYDCTPSMKSYIDDNVHMKETAKALNVLYCFDRSYEPYLISWLFPLQVAFKEDAGEREHVYEMALYVHLLANGCFPKWPEVFAIAERVIEALRIADEELLLHLQKIAKMQPNIDPKGFLIQLITVEKTKAEKLSTAAPGSRKESDGSAELLTDPLVYLRRWIGEGFVRVLDTPAVIWLWDQLFLEKWNRKVLVDASLALLLLLKHKFVEATDHTSMAQVFLVEPCKLYTRDIQRAWMHLQYGGQPGEVPSFNRRAPKPPPCLDPVGIKSVTLEITFPADVIQQEVWVKNFDPEDIKLLCSAYFGATELKPQVTSGKASCPMGARVAQNGDVTFKVYFPKSVWKFEKLDPSQLDVETELGAHPDAILQADYYGHTDTKSGRALPITLGWARLQLFKHQPEGSSIQEEESSGWLMLKQTESYKLMPGQVPDNLPIQPEDVAPPNDPVFISPVSELKATIFDLRHDTPLSPVPTPLPSKKASKETMSQSSVLYESGSDPALDQECSMTSELFNEPETNNSGQQLLGVKQPSPDIGEQCPPRDGPPQKSRSPVKLPLLPKKPFPRATPWVKKRKLPLKLPEVTVERFQTLDIESVTPESSDRKSTASDRKSTASNRNSTASERHSTSSDRRSTASSGSSREKKIAESRDVAQKRWSMLKRPPMLWRSVREPTPSPAVDAPTVNEKFDFYIDLVENIPDNASIVKVTGRIIKMGELSGIPDIQELPDMKSSARSPVFRYRLTVNKDQLAADSNMMVLLRVYTIDRDSKDPKELCVIGSCLFGFFNSNGVLRVGCHRRLLRSGLPDLSKGIGDLDPLSLHHAPRVPGAAICLRLLPNSKSPQDPPRDMSAYMLDQEEMTNSETNIVSSYSSDPADPNQWPQTVTNMVKQLQTMENQVTNAEAPRVWMKERLNQQKHLPPKQPANNLPLSLMVHYRMPPGINVQVSRAYGLPGGRYVQCFSRVLLGQDVEHKQPTREGYGKRDMFLTACHDFNACQKAPVWVDKPKRVHPHPDWYNCLLVQLVGLQVVYHPTEDHNHPGKVTTKSGGKVTLTADSVIGWAIVPLMKRWCVWSGEFHVPVLKQKPDEEFLQDLSRRSVEEVFQSREWKPNDLIEGASLVVKVWDGHFIQQELPQGFKPVDTFLNIVGDIGKYELAQRDTSGKKLYQVVLMSLGKKYQKLGTNSFIFEKEKGYFTNVMETTFTNMMVAALEAAGYSPLTA